MKPFNGLRKTIATLLSLSVIWVGVFAGVAQASMIQTQQMQAAEQVNYDRQQLVEILNQDAVQQQLMAMGVEPEVAEERVNNMTPSELSQLNNQINQLPAGSGVVGVILVIFIVFVITDVIGATNIFPFINSVGK